MMAKILQEPYWQQYFQVPIDGLILFKNLFIITDDTLRVTHRFYSL